MYLSWLLLLLLLFGIVNENTEIQNTKLKKNLFTMHLRVYSWILKRNTTKNNKPSVSKKYTGATVKNTPTAAR